MNITIEQIQELERKISYIFQNNDLVYESLSHPSLKQHPGSNKLDYERLELLGDAVLSMVITEELFNRYLNYDEGKLAKIRANLVCKERICEVADQISLQNYIAMTKGEEISGGRKNPNNIENAMEAVIAAIYLDGGFHAVRKVILYLWGRYFQLDLQSIEEPKSSLQEYAQGKAMEIPRYEVLSKEGKDHDPKFKVKVILSDGSADYGEGRTVKSAEKLAAQNLLKQLGE